MNAFTRQSLDPKGNWVPTPQAAPGCPIATHADAITMTQADGFVVVSWWRDKSSPVPPYKGTYSYEHFDTLNEAYACHRDYENGEFANASAMGVFAALGGMPVGGRIV